MNPKEELKSIVNSGRIPNSLMFQGPNGSGRLRSAIEFANKAAAIAVTHPGAYYLTKKDIESLHEKV